MRKIFILLVSLLLILIGCSEKINSDLTQKIQGQGNRLLTYTLSPEEIWVGVPVTLTLKMKGEKDDDVLFNKPETLPENLRLIEAKADDNQLKITLKADKPGEYALPPLSVMFENPRENVELLTRPMEFSVISLVEEGSENSFSGLWDAMKIGFLPLWQVLVIFIGLILTGLFLFWLLYWRKREKTVPPEPVWAVLERDLARLTSDKNLLDQDRGRFYDLTVSLVKKGLDGVYEQHTGEQTREEFSSALILCPQLDSEVKLWLTRFFERADLVRFARGEVEKDISQADLYEVVRFTGEAIAKAKEPPPEDDNRPETKEEISL
jgi:hypothetical protein